jgi:hypothetical protein
MKKLPKFSEQLNEQNNTINESNVYKVYGREQHVDDNATMDLVWMMELHKAYQEVYATPEFRSWLRGLTANGYDAELWYDSYEAPSTGIDMDGRKVYLKDILYPTLNLYHEDGTSTYSIYETTYGRYKIAIKAELDNDGTGWVLPLWASK